MGGFPAAGGDGPFEYDGSLLGKWRVVEAHWAPAAGFDGAVEGAGRLIVVSDQQVFGAAFERIQVSADGGVRQVLKHVLTEQQIDQWQFVWPI